MESAAMGLLAGLFLGCRLNRKPIPKFERKTALGALLSYVSGYEGSDFQPMNINFEIMAPLEERIRDKKLRHAQISKRAEKEFTAALTACDMEEERALN
jgi:methylenetetrahydrofolate--tRNA-(uracil-5-)-methyltransferase